MVGVTSGHLTNFRQPIEKKKPSGESVFSRSVELGFFPLPLLPRVSFHFLSCLTRFLVDLLQGIAPVRLVVMPSTSWNRLFRRFDDWRVEAGSILVDTVLGEGDRLGVDVSEFPEALPEEEEDEQLTESSDLKT